MEDVLQIYQYTTMMGFTKTTSHYTTAATLILRYIYDQFKIKSYVLRSVQIAL